MFIEVSGVSFEGSVGGSVSGSGTAGVGTGGGEGGEGSGTPGAGEEPEDAVATAEAHVLCAPTSGAEASQATGQFLNHSTSFSMIVSFRILSRSVGV